MPRHVRSTKLETRSNRLKLPIRRKPHFVTVAPGTAIGYRRCKGPGRWIVRGADGHGGNWTKAFALADDFEDADGERVLTFWQASDRARVVARGTEGAGNRPATIGEALDHYETDLRARGGDLRNANRVRYHMPAALAERTISLLGARELRNWRNGLVKRGLTPAAADRSARALKAALNLAAKDDARITNAAAWRDGLARLPDGERTRNVVLSDDIVGNLVAAAYDFGRDFGLLVETAATTGARTSQMLALRVEDLIEDGAGPRLMMPSSRKGRRRTVERKPVPIPPSLAAALRATAAGRPALAPLLVPTSPRLFPKLVARLGLGLETTAYALRHSSITRMLLAGVPLRVVAALHDTSSAMIERTYSRSIGAHSDSMVRAAMLDVKRPAVTNVVALKG